jgi:hypothetical protein
MRREALQRWRAHRVIHEVGQFVEESASRDRGAMSGDVTCVATVAHRERALQDVGDARGPLGTRMIAREFATPAEQVRQTGLMGRVREVPIRRPAVTHQDAIIVGAEDRGRLLKAATRLNGIQDHRGRGERPQPLHVTADLPARFVGTDDWARANCVAQRAVGRARLPCGAVQRVGDRARPHNQAKPLAQQRRDLAVGQPEIFVQQHDQRDGLWPQMCAGSAQRIGGLQRMAPLHAAATCPALADVHLKPADVRPHHGQLFLDLIRDARFVEGAPARGTARGQRHVDRLVHVRRRVAMSVTAVAPTGAATGRLRARRGRAFRERRGLPLRCPAREIKFLLQPLVLAAQPFVLALDPLALLPFLIPLTLRTLDPFTPITFARVLTGRRHAAFMADSRK